MTHVFQNALIDRLPASRGRMIENAPMGPSTWFRTGGVAEIMFRPADLDDLLQLLKAKPADVPVTVIGVGSNLLIRDGGIPGIVIRLGKAFASIEITGEEISVGSAALDHSVAQACLEHGVSGLEFLIGIPGTIGGALRMNAGAYGREMKDVTTSIKAVDVNGDVHKLTNAEIGFGYRKSDIPENWIFLSSRLKGAPGEQSEIEQRMNEIRTNREAAQPLRTRTGGSTFANPPGIKAWELIEKAGCRGLCKGGAMVSEKHCNFLINTGDASAGDIEALGEEVRDRVRETSGVELEWEIRRIGKPATGGAPS
ncbi:MAG: UDP-N-acetylmuramate dehydrogenase [Rhodospirillaceae bacterium]|jgi:UDP-N-acetylmuramate dehydrogenase|nr:UDP-N-acetylmuramate dehydrogenase [Rhodospirillaceae bacterium]MBT5751077.1 UDP-N-acetylmuramate dehydrogenase [Rhodospirillaceae bacterium]